MEAEMILVFTPTVDHPTSNVWETTGTGTEGHGQKWGTGFKAEKLTMHMHARRNQKGTKKKKQEKYDSRGNLYIYIRSIYEAYVINIYIAPNNTPADRQKKKVMPCRAMPCDTMRCCDVCACAPVPG